MSYDLAVWEGALPGDDAAARTTLDNLLERYASSGAGHAPTPLITKYVAGLLDNWPDLSEDEDDTSPWSSGPLIGEARGPLIYFPMRYSMADEASAFAARLAASMGLVCFDPQVDGLRSE